MGDYTENLKKWERGARGGDLWLKHLKMCGILPIRIISIMKTVLRLWGAVGFILLIMAVPVYAQEDFAINFNSGYIGYGGNFPLNDNYDSELTLTALTIGMEHLSTNIGFEFSPYQYFGWAFANGDKSTSHSLFNLHLYWNVINILDGFIFFGPFTSINYLIVRETVYWDKFVFTAGGHIGLKFHSGRLNYNIVSAEMGYRNISGKSQYFLGVKADVASFFLALFLTALSAGSAESKESSKRK